MKKIIAMLMALVMVFGLVACGSSAPAATEAPKADAPAATEAPVEATPAEKAPEDYTGNLVVYSPHDADPLNAGIAMFQAAYPNINVEVIAAGTGELTQRIAAEAENPQGDVLWGGGADTLAGFPDLFQPSFPCMTMLLATLIRMQTICGSANPPCPWFSSTTRP